MQQIKDITSIGQRCYIPAKENPADGKSMGLNAAQGNSDDCWFQRSPFLWQNMKFWKVQMSRYIDPELKKNITSSSTLLSEDIIMWITKSEVG